MDESRRLELKREQEKRRRARNGEHVRALQRATYHRNRDKNIEAMKEYRDSLDPEFRKARNREYNRIWREKHREELRAYMREYAGTPEQRLKQRDVKGRRRAREHGTTAGPVNILTLLDSHDGTCGICGQPLDINTDVYHLDHIIPLAAGGTHTQNNLQVAHSSCNFIKNKHLPKVSSEPNQAPPEDQT
jgi:5-methylcytosine-specific restriction endonuclease McrA